MGETLTASTDAGPDGDGADAGSPFLEHLPAGDELEALKAWLERESGQWSFLDRMAGVPAPAWEDGAAAVLGHEGAGGRVGPAALLRIDAELRRLARLRQRWDELLGHLALLLRQLGLWRDMVFLSFGHDCTEQLRLSGQAPHRLRWSFPPLAGTARLVAEG